MIITSAGVSHVGKKRKTNQDSIYLNPENHLYLVADGVGGHRGGDVASKMAISLIPEYLLQQQLNEENVREHLCKAVERANEKIMDRGSQSEQLSDMGTTVTGICFLKNYLYVFNVGDSRVYLFHAGEIYQLTCDHTLVQEKLNMGVYDREKAARDKMKNILVESVGHKKEVRVDVHRYHASADDYLLICSDGLYDQLGDEGILELLLEKLPPAGGCEESQLQQAVDTMVEVVNERGGDDNTSIIIIALQ